MTTQPPATQPEHADYRQLLTYLLEQYDRVVSVHAAVQMDTDADRALHSRAIAAFTQAAEPVRQALASDPPSTGRGADGDRRAARLALFTAEDAAVAAGRPLTVAEIRAVTKALPYSSMGEAFTEVVCSIAALPDDEDPATGQVPAGDLTVGTLYRTAAGDWACARTIQQQAGQVVVGSWRGDQDVFTPTAMVAVRTSN